MTRQAPRRSIRARGRAAAQGRTPCTAICFDDVSGAFRIREPRGTQDALVDSANTAVTGQWPGRGIGFEGSRSGERGPGHRRVAHGSAPPPGARPASPNRKGFTRVPRHPGSYPREFREGGAASARHTGRTSSGGIQAEEARQMQVSSAPINGSKKTEYARSTKPAELRSSSRSLPVPSGRGSRQRVLLAVWLPLRISPAP